MNRLLLLLPLLAACGKTSEACLDYVDAADACFAEAEEAGLDVDVESGDAEGFCEEFADISDDQWACETKAFQDGDCTTDAGLAAITEARDACAEG